MKGELPTGYVTPRQLQVWRLIALGRHLKEIARSLGITAKTAERHRGELFHRIGAHNGADAARMAIECAVITVEVRPLYRVAPGTRGQYMILPTLR